MLFDQVPLNGNAAGRVLSFTHTANSFYVMKVFVPTRFPCEFTSQYDAVTFPLVSPPQSQDNKISRSGTAFRANRLHLSLYLGLLLRVNYFKVPEEAGGNGNELHGAKRSSRTRNRTDTGKYRKRGLFLLPLG